MYLDSKNDCRSERSSQNLSFLVVFRTTKINGEFDRLWENSTERWGVVQRRRPAAHLNQRRAETVGARPACLQSAGLIRSVQEGVTGPQNRLHDSKSTPEMHKGWARNPSKRGIDQLSGKNTQIQARSGKKAVRWAHKRPKSSLNSWLGLSWRSWSDFEL